MAWFFRHESCSKSLAALRDRIETLERQQKTLAQDTKDAEDYIQRLSARVLKRLDRAKEPAAEPESAEGYTDPVSAAIHARRNRNGGR